MRLLVLCLSSLLLSGCCGTLLQGEVRDVEHRPVPGARVTVDATGAVRYTNSNGRYAVAMPCRAEPLLVRVLAHGYPEVSDMIASPGGHLTRNWVLGRENDEGGAYVDDGVPRGAPPPRRQPPERTYEPEPEPERTYEPEPEPERTYEPEPEPEPEVTPPSRTRYKPARARTVKRPCPACNTSVPKGETHCPGCGERYLDESAGMDDEPEDRSSSAPARASGGSSGSSGRASGGKSCPTCMTSVPKGTTDCPGCGDKVYD